MLDVIKLLENKVKVLEKYIDDISVKMNQIPKTYLNKTINNIKQNVPKNGMYTALVVDTFDIYKQNRVRYFNPILVNPKDPNNQSIQVTCLPWAFPISTFGGFDDSGSTWVPPAGSTVCLIFEHGNSDSAYYMGTTWTRDRGPDGNHYWGLPVPEYDLLYEGKRNNYLVGPNDGSQVLPPWNTESYNGYDITSTNDIDKNLDALKRSTFPNIYGFKTPEKHMLKMVDGDGKCNRKWKRMELLSGCGNWMIFKDDHLHYCGQWSHPECGDGTRDGSTNCYVDASEPNQNEDPKSLAASPAVDFELNSQTYDYITDIVEPGLPFSKETPIGFPQPVTCGKQSENVIGGHPDTPEGTIYANVQKGTNPFFKAKNECRPIKGPQTPQNNKCDLPQTGIQFLSISGHTFVMDDSVEEPRGTPDWQRSLEQFDFGCTDKYLGRTYWKSCTGHSISMIDYEQPSQVRTNDNGIKVKSALGNQIFLCDETISECPGLGGLNRGISMNSTSNHVFKMIDEGVFQKDMSCRTEFNTPINNATNAYIQLRSGYGLELYMSDRNDQQKTSTQFIRITAPQKDNKERGPHVFEMQERSIGRGYVYLRAGGNYLQYSYDSTYEIVGDSKNNPADKISLVTKDRVAITSNYDYKTNEYFFNASKKRIYLLAGLGDCKTKSTNQETFCVAPVVVYKDGKLRISDRIFSSCSEDAKIVSIAAINPIAEENENVDQNNNQNANQNNQILVV